jgi:HK97 gp10 family phage protein
VSIKIDLKSLKAELQVTQKRIQAAGRPAAQAAAQVIYEAARINAPVSDAAHFFYGKGYKLTGVRYGPFKPGNLRDSIYQVFSEKKSSATVKTYHVSWNRLKAPYGAMVELGTSSAPAHSFIGKAIAEKGSEATQAMKRVFIEEVKPA